MGTVFETEELMLEPADNRVLANFCGQRDEHLRQIEQRLGVQINNRGNHFRVVGPADTARVGARVILELFELARTEALDPQRVHIWLQDAAVNESNDTAPLPGDGEPGAVRTRRSSIRPRCG